MKIILVLLFLFSCNSEPVSEKPSVLVSVVPYAFFVEKIAGDALEVQILVPPGANPHVYEPSPKQVEKAYLAKVWFRLDEPSEKKIFSVLCEQNRAMKMVDLSEGLDLIGDCHHEGADKHIWLSPKLAEKQATLIAQTLGEMFPQMQQQFQKGLDSFLKDLESLDAEIGAKLKPFAGDALLVSHPAFGYYCREFGLKQLSIEYEGKDPLPQDIEQTLKEAKESHVRAVFTQIQYNNKGAELIAEKLHLPVYSVDPYASDYLENLRHITELIIHD